MEQEGRHALQRDLGDDAERAEPDAGRRRSTLGLVGRRALHDRPSAGDQLEPDDLRREAAERGAGAVGAGEIAPAMVCRSMSPRLGSAQAVGRQLRVELVQRRAGARRCTRPASRRSERTPVRRVEPSCTPSVTATPVNVWPAPTALTRRPRPRPGVDLVATSASLRGVATRAAARTRCRPSWASRRCDDAG